MFEVNKAVNQNCDMKILLPMLGNLVIGIQATSRLLYLKRFSAGSIKTNILCICLHLTLQSNIMTDAKSNNRKSF